MAGIRDFVNRHYRHFNAAVVSDAARAWDALLQRDGKMFLTLAGAMSTAELGISVAELIRRDKVHAICCTGANLEEDLYNLVAYNSYERFPNYRELSAQQEKALLARGMNRVTDTGIPEEAAFKKIERYVLQRWQQAEAAAERYFPHEFLYHILRSGVLAPEYENDPKNSWLLAAAEKNLPLWTPGWEDSTLGNTFVAQLRKGNLARLDTVKSGLEQMNALVGWYREHVAQGPIGFFQIGGGIAGDFPICVVPLIRQELHEKVPLWAYFCQISDSTTSYGSYSGAVPNEKITWEKVDADTPKFVIESDATIVFPLIAEYLLES